jgi:hypothetical protein
MGKKTVPDEEAPPSLTQFRAKRKWQMALRRYILHKKANESYAHYFGLGIDELRKWIELQFTEDLDWENFGQKWQFDHIVPVAYFDLSSEEDLVLCWNFTNIRVERSDLNKNRGQKVDEIAAKAYFQALYEKTNYSYCLRLIKKIEQIEFSELKSNPLLEEFIINNRDHLEIIPTLSKEEFGKLNSGFTMDNIILEREIIRKFGV